MNSPGHFLRIVLVFILVMGFLIFPALSWDMDSAETLHGSSADTSLIGKTVYVYLDTSEGNSDNIIGVVENTQNGLLYFNNPWISDYQDINGYLKHNGPYWVSTSRINEMYITTDIPGEGTSDESKEQPGMTAPIALIGLIVSILIFKRRG